MASRRYYWLWEWVAVVIALVFVFGSIAWAIWYNVALPEEPARFMTVVQVCAAVFTAASVLVMLAQNYLNKQALHDAEEDQKAILVLQQKLVDANVRATEAIEATKLLQERIVKLAEARHPSEMALLLQGLSEGYRKSADLVRKRIGQDVSAATRAPDSLKLLRFMVLSVLGKCMGYYTGAGSLSVVGEEHSKLIENIRSALIVSEMGLGIKDDDMNEATLKIIFGSIAFTTEPRPPYASTWTAIHQKTTQLWEEGLSFCKASLSVDGDAMIDAVCKGVRDKAIPAILKEAQEKQKALQAQTHQEVPEDEVRHANEFFEATAMRVLEGDKQRLHDEVRNILSVLNAF